jgi:adenosylcobinamide-phosphate synthase
VSPLVLVGALALDLLLAEPPARIHPVVWMGKLIASFDRHASGGEGARVAWGAALLITGVALSFGLTWAALRLLGQVSAAAQLFGAMVLLKTTFSVRGLGAQALRVHGALAAGDLQAARRETQMLVSRPTHDLDPPRLVSATIESVAENTLDSIVAPLFWFMLLGVPGAMAYRFVNTADAMIGYHGEYEHLGKAVARADDGLNWVPARLTALLLVAAAWLARLQPARAWRLTVRDHGLTESPNAGWTMAAAAGALTVPLEKVGHYRLGEDLPDKLVPAKIGDAVRLMAAATALMVALVLALQLARSSWT